MFAANQNPLIQPEWWELLDFYHYCFKYHEFFKQELEQALGPKELLWSCSPHYSESAFFKLEELLDEKLHIGLHFLYLQLVDQKSAYRGETPPFSLNLLAGKKRWFPNTPLNILFFNPQKQFLYDIETIIFNLILLWKNMKI